MRRHSSFVLKISLIYTLFSIIWIISTDNLVKILTNSKSQFAFLAMYKGLFFIVINALLLYYFLNREFYQSVYFQNLFEHSPEGIVMLDNDHKVINANKGFKAIFQYTDEEVLGCDINDLVLPEGLKIGQGEAVKKRKDGSLVDVSILTYPIMFNHSNVGTYVIYSDISERKKIEEKLRVSEEKFSKAFHITPDAITINRLDNGEYLEINEGFSALTGYSKAEALGQTPLSLNIWVKAEERKRFMQQLIEDGEVRDFENLFRTKDNRVIVGLLSGKILEISGERYLLVISRDITERRRAEEQLKYLSLHDNLTGLYNRAYFEQEMVRLADGPNYPVGIIICDLDGLKLVNDTLGHKFGDNLLVAAANVIKKSLRVSSMVSRIGGDEFVALLSNTSKSELENTCDRIRQAIEEYNLLNTAIPLSLSIGLAISSYDTERPVDIFKEADNNMYREKLHRSQSVRSAIVQTLMKTLEARDFITEGHADRLQNLVKDLATAIGLPERTINDLRLLAEFHDIGKVGIPDHILFKPGRLNHEETSEMRRHTEIGYRIAQSAPDLALIADWILKHHEWWDGNGYPLGLKGEEIPLECRILAIADAYDAMTSDRPYRQAMLQREALTELVRCAGSQFDPQLVEKFVCFVNIK